MAIIEKPSSTSEIFASPEEVRTLAKPVIEVSVSDFVESLEQPEVQEILDQAERCAAT